MFRQYIHAPFYKLAQRRCSSSSLAHGAIQSAMNTLFAEAMAVKRNKGLSLPVCSQSSMHAQTALVLTSTLVHCLDLTHWSSSSTLFFLLFGKMPTTTPDMWRRCKDSATQHPQHMQQGEMLLPQPRKMPGTWLPYHGQLDTLAPGKEGGVGLPSSSAERASYH